MTSRTAAARYARALLDVAAAESIDTAAISTELNGFRRFLQAQPVLSKLLLNPAVPSPRKRAAMEQLVQQARLTPVVSKLLVLLASRDRLALIDPLVTVYEELLAERQNVVHAELTSAEPLSPERVAAIEQRLAALTGKQVRMRTKVDNGIIGGVVARVGSTVYDASIATQLRKIRERLTT